MLTLHSSDQYELLPTAQWASEPISSQKQHFFPKYPNLIFVNTIWLSTSWKNNYLRLAYLCQPLRAVYSQICNYKLFRAFKISRRVRWPGWTILLKLTMKTHFYTKYPNRIFVNRIWLHTPREKNNLFVSVYWQVSHYQLFRTLKTFQNNSLSWVNRSSEPHHENVIFIQNN